MRRWFRSWLSRWADESARRTILDLQRKLEVERNAVAVITAERDLLAAVVARDRERVLMETAEHARKGATGA